MAENVEDAARAADAERALGRTFAVGIPVLTLVAAIGVGAWLSVGPAILVVAAGMLLSVIAFIWASLRTLSGDAPLPEGMEGIARRALSTSAGEEKRRVLRALKDLELEHSIGKIDDADFAQVSARYREEAKALMRESDLAIEPLRAKAEAMARAHLAKKGLAKGASAAIAAGAVTAPEAHPTTTTDDAGDDDDDAANAAKLAAPKRLDCPKCSTSNEPDAAFCKKCGTSLTAAEARDATA